MCRLMFIRVILQLFFDNTRIQNIRFLGVLIIKSKIIVVFGGPTKITKPELGLVQISSSSIEFHAVLPDLAIYSE